MYTKNVFDNVELRDYLIQELLRPGIRWFIQVETLFDILKNLRANVISDEEGMATYPALCL